MCVCVYICIEKTLMKIYRKDNDVVGFRQFCCLLIYTLCISKFLLLLTLVVI